MVQQEHESNTTTGATFDGGTATYQYQGTTTTNYSANCLYKLPCGYCTMLNRPCPMQWNTTINPVWKPPYEFTCATGSDENVISKNTP